MTTDEIKSYTILTLSHQSYLIPFQQHNEHDLDVLRVNQKRSNNNHLIVLSVSNDVRLLTDQIYRQQEHQFKFELIDKTIDTLPSK